MWSKEGRKNVKEKCEGNEGKKNVKEKSGGNVKEKCKVTNKV